MWRGLADSPNPSTFSTRMSGLALLPGESEAGPAPFPSRVAFPFRALPLCWQSHFRHSTFVGGCPGHAQRPGVVASQNRLCALQPRRERRHLEVATMPPRVGRSLPSVPTPRGRISHLDRIPLRDRTPDPDLQPPPNPEPGLRAGKCPPSIALFQCWRRTRVVRRCRPISASCEVDLSTHRVNRQHLKGLPSPLPSCLPVVRRRWPTRTLFQPFPRDYRLQVASRPLAGVHCSSPNSSPHDMCGLTRIATYGRPFAPMGVRVVSDRRLDPQIVPASQGTSKRRLNTTSKRRTSRMMLNPNHFCHSLETDSRTFGTLSSMSRLTVADLPGSLHPQISDRHCNQRLRRVPDELR